MVENKTLKGLALALTWLGMWASAMAEDVQTIDVSAQNTDKSYVNYTTEWTIPATKTINILSARYTYLYNKVSGSGKIELRSGGERTLTSSCLAESIFRR